MELIGNFDFKLTYHPGRELFQADDLSCIYFQELQYDGSLEPDRPMIYALMKNNIYPTDVSKRQSKNWSRIKVSSKWIREQYASKENGL